MNPKDFQNSSSGHCKLIAGKEYWAFIPNSLPPQLKASWELANVLSEADRALSELAGAGRLLPNPHLLIQPAMRREAVLSSRIEGTQASLSDLFYFEAGMADAGRPDDVLEVSNYVKALEHGLYRLKTLPLSARLLREIHEKLMNKVRGEYATPGEFRRSQNWIGRPGCTLNDASFVPPPVEEMQVALSDLEKYIHSPLNEPPLVRAALLHYQFEAIHPFLDGNGRVGRLLITLFLCAQGILPEPFLYLSAYFEKYRDEYYRQLLAISQEGSWDAWLHFFLKGVALQSKEALAAAKSLQRIREKFQKAIEGKRIPTAAHRLAEQLFLNPVASPVQLAKLWKLSYPAVMKGVEYFRARKLLREATGKPRGRLFVCDEIMKILNQN